MYLLDVGWRWRVRENVCPGRMMFEGAICGSGEIDRLKSVVVRFEVYTATDCDESIVQKKDGALTVVFIMEKAGGERT